MLVKSFGCSFIFGTDLADAGPGYPVKNADGIMTPRGSQHTWPALYAKHLGYRYDCLAQPGCGNLHIAEYVLNHSNDNALYIVGWTWIDRFDYVDPKSTRWNAIRPVDTTSVAQTYYRDLHSQYRDKLTSLIHAKIVIDTLKEKGHPFIMTYMDDLMFEADYRTGNAVVDLQKYVRPYMTRFEDKDFLTWSRCHGYPESPGWHPLEQAHAQAADYIIETFDKKNTNAR
jgi:hypothetical protein